MSGEARKTYFRVSAVWKLLASTDENNENFQADSTTQCWHFLAPGENSNGNYIQET